METPVSHADEPVTYRIGLASRLSGVPTHTIRKWEERYRLVEPMRTEGGERMFTPVHVRRLALLKSLSDAGMDIGTLARMSDDALERATVELRPVSREPAPAHPRPRVLAVGEALPQLMRQHAARFDKLDCLVDESVTIVDDIRARADIVLVECASVQRDTGDIIERAITTSGARAALVVYGFGARLALRTLRSERVSVVRAPVEPTELQRLILGMWYDLSAWPEIILSGRGPGHSEPPRFSQSTLMRVASISPAMACECPHHLAELLMAVSAFERYSLDCEDTQPHDAQLHGFLGATAASARVLFEDALVEVARAEGISLVDQA